MRTNGFAPRKQLVVFVTVCALIATGCSSPSKKVSPPTTSRASSEAEAEAYNKKYPPTEVRTITRGDGTKVKLPYRRITPVVPDVPEPPKAFLPPGGADGRAKQLAVETEAGGTRADAAWLTAYDLAGIPVKNNAGKPVGSTGDDPFGPRFSDLWMFADSAGNLGLPLTEALALTISPSAPLPKEQEAEAAAVFVDDVRSMLRSDSERSRTLGGFLEAKIRPRPGTPSLHDRRFDPSTATVDMPTMNFLNWLINKSVVEDAIPAIAEPLRETDATPTAAPSVGQRGFGVRQMPRTQSILPATEGTNCGAIFFEDGGHNSAIQTLIQKAIGGQAVLGGDEAPAWEGIISYIAEHVDTKAVEQRTAWEEIAQEGGVSVKFRSAEWKAKVQSAAAVMEKIGVITAALSLLLQVNAMRAKVVLPPGARELEPLVRGENVITVVFELTVEASELPDGNNRAMCAANLVTNALGVGIAFPAAGPLSNVEVLIKEGVGFSENNYTSPDQLVIFNDMNFRKMVTDDKGIIRPSFQSVGGGANSSKFASGAVKLNKYFSVYLSAQPETTTYMSIVSIFLDGLTFLNPLSWVSGLIDILKTQHFSLGEFRLPYTDFGPAINMKISGGILGTLAGYFCQSLPVSKLVGEYSDVEMRPALPDPRGTTIRGGFTEKGKGGEEWGKGQFEIWKDGDAWRLKVTGKRAPTGQQTRKYENIKEAFLVTPATDECKNIISGGAPPTWSPERIGRFLGGPAYVAPSTTVVRP